MFLHINSLLPSSGESDQAAAHGFLMRHLQLGLSTVPEIPTSTALEVFMPVIVRPSNMSRLFHLTAPRTAENLFGCAEVSPELLVLL